MLRGLSTTTVFATDVDAATAWYSEFLGAAPYFTRAIDGATAYAEFRIGDHQHELGIIDARFAPHPTGASGALVYWHVDDVPATLERLRALGATDHEQLVERGPGFVTASMVDPFGNVLAVMYNRHYLDMLA
ncbi:VOC family protein [Nocardia stercoris]|uniref:VOC family protein n=1 Tax=Nocardia stercoris TaxID=2483361 RepID=A0A3M2LE81_9NOCA|nr:VOC family protein [Nocardia stercoris]RMI35356.1 VOC family protein [Nocardia stercoris]